MYMCKCAHMEENVLLLCPSTVRELRFYINMLLFNSNSHDWDSVLSTENPTFLKLVSMEFSATSLESAVQSLYVFSSRYALPSWPAKMQREK